MCQAIGTMQLDRDASPLGLVARAWAADVEPLGYVQSVDGIPRQTLATMRPAQAKFILGDAHKLSTQTKPLMKAFKENTNVSE